MFINMQYQYIKDFTILKSFLFLFSFLIKEIIEFVASQDLYFC